jgi:hypothetical protein
MHISILTARSVKLIQVKHAHGGETEAARPAPERSDLAALSPP